MKRFIIGILILVGWLSGFGQILTDSNLPIVVIETDGGVAIPNEPKVLGNMKIIWHQDGSRNYLKDINNPIYLNYNGRIGIETRGSSSQSLPKKPYGLTTLQADNVTNNNVSIFGMPKENDWVLNSLAFDETGMRDVLSYELSELCGQYAPRRVYCEVVVNGDYKGLYVFMEKIKVDDDRVNIEKTGGYIVQTDRANNGFAWWMPTYVTNASGVPEYSYFVYHYPKADDITEAQTDYIHNVFNALADQSGSHNTSIESGIPSVIDIPSFVDFMMIAEFSSNVDVYALSTFFHKDRCGKLRAGPVWDYNLAYGHDEFGNRSRYDVWQFDDTYTVCPKFWKDLFDTEMFRCYLARRWNGLTQSGQPLNYDVVCARIDEIDRWILEGVGRDNQRWNKMTHHAAEIQSMKTWIGLRINWLTQNIGSYSGCAEMDQPPLVISKINYHPIGKGGFDADQLEFLEITNNGDEEVDLTGMYFRELGVTYCFPAGSSVAPHEAIMLCSDSVAFAEYYGEKPFAQFERKLSDKSEHLVLADAWGNVIDDVWYFGSSPWPWEANGGGAFLQLVDLNSDNSLAENWKAVHGNSVSSENDAAEALWVFPNPTEGLVTIAGREGNYRIANMMGQVLMTGSIEGESQQVDVSHLPAGIYIVAVGSRNKKLIIR